MPEWIDLHFFQKICDPVDRWKIEKVVQWQHNMLETNRMDTDTTAFEIRLNGKTVHFEKAAAVNALEIYQEIFRDQEHGRLPEFVPTEKTGVVLDIGANYGFYAMWVKSRAPGAHILCVEPNPHVFKYLKRNLRGLDRIDYMQKALAAAPGFETFDYIRQIPSIAGKTIGMIQRPWLQAEMVDNCRVAATTLTRVLEKYQGKKIDILKMDIEGAEGDVLAHTPAGALAHVRRIVLERHSPELRRAVYASLSSAGFRLEYESDPECRQYYGSMYFSRE